MPPLVLDGTNGVSGVDGTASNPAIEGTDSNTGVFFPAADTVAIGTGGTEALRVNSSQNVGIGTASPGARLDVSTGTTNRLRVSESSSQLYFDSLNAGATAWSAKVERATTLSWLVAPSGTPSSGMTLDASGNLLVGTTSGSYAITARRAPAASDNQIMLEAYRTTGANSGVGDYLSTANGLYGHKYIGSNWFGSLIGTTGIVFNTGTLGSETERARITSGGNLLVGSTTDDARLRVNGTAVVGRFVADGGGYANDVVLIDTSGTAAGTGFDLIQANAGGAGQFRVRGDGTLFAQNTTVQSISDQRVKENIRDADEGLAVVTALRPVRFDFKEGFGNDRKNQLGFIAQEIQQVFPDAVDVAAKEETDDEDAEPYKTVGAAALIPVLVKAIQEQQAMIQELKAEIAALKGNA